MPRYLAERAFHEGWNLDGDLGEVCEQIPERNRDEVTWLHAYVSDDRRKLFRVYEAPTPEAIRRSAAQNDLPVESITSVRVLDPHHFTP